MNTLAHLAAVIVSFAIGVYFLTHTFTNTPTGVSIPIGAGLIIVGLMWLVLMIPAAAADIEVIHWDHGEDTADQHEEGTE